MAEATPDVWIDVSAALTQRAGIARYVRGLTEALVAMDPADRGFTLGTYSHSWRDAGARPFEVPHASTPLLVRPWRLQLLAGHALRRRILPGVRSVGRFIATDMAVPFADANDVIATVYDMTTFTHPQAHSLLTRVNARIALSRIRSRGYRVVAISNRTARDTTRLAGIEPSRISVIHPGVSEAFLDVPTPDAIEEALAKYGVLRPFAITVGTLEPRKNLRRLITAFRSVATPNESLIIVGARGWGADASIGDEFKGVGNVRAIGFVPDADLACLYHACATFVLPSLSEGYGFPVAEALACGANVICSRECGVVEVVPDTVAIVDPLGIEGMAEALRVRMDMTPVERNAVIPRTYTQAALAHSSLVRDYYHAHAT